MDARSAPRQNLTADGPFDRHAARYSAVWGQDPVARRQRDAIWALATEAFPACSRVLDGGCGVGIDLRWLVDQGHVAVGVDASPGMIAEARARVPEAELHVGPLDLPETLAPLGRFDAAILDFGVLNCLDLTGAAHALAGALVPGAPLILVPMPRFNPSWTLAELRAGHLRRALGRLSGTVDVDVEGAPVRTRYLGARAVMAAFAPWFTLEERAGLGFLLPPPGTRWPEARLDRLAEAEERLRRLPLLRDVGDHLRLLLRRNMTSAPPGSW